MIDGLDLKIEIAFSGSCKGRLVLISVRHTDCREGEGQLDDLCWFLLVPAVDCRNRRRRPEKGEILIAAAAARAWPERKKTTASSSVF